MSAKKYTLKCESGHVEVKAPLEKGGYEFEDYMRTITEGGAKQVEISPQ